MPVFDQIAGFGVVPVIAIHDAKHALPLADALIAGGLPLAEITFRTQAAPEAIRLIAAHRPALLVGAGTVLTEGQTDDALAAGAAFALSPGIDRAVVDHATRVGLPFAPGIMTPSDLQIALRAGCQMVKFFPAMAAGGPKMLQNIATPYLHTGITFNPTGGVTLDNMGDWLTLAFVRAVGGTWIATSDDIAAGNWDRIAENARQAAAKARSLRA
jgi:2-dehydro-3-deoxyphosphogluconate aldolase / (4S)-4-hydroxy-2-oxoglutarate aldolase